MLYNTTEHQLVCVRQKIIMGNVPTYHISIVYFLRRKIFGKFIKLVKLFIKP